MIKAVEMVFLVIHFLQLAQIFLWKGKSREILILDKQHLRVCVRAHGVLGVLLMRWAAVVEICSSTDLY